MKKIITSLLFSLASLCVFSQSNYNISGKVIDATTKQPLAAASVFAENTTLGTATGPEGTFQLKLPGGGYSIVVTFTGYQTETRRVSAGDAGNNEMVIELKQKEKSLEEFVIKSTSEVKDGLAKYGDFFMENFIGKTANSKQCFIKNKEALRFFYYRRAKRLKVIASAPLEIVNNALGYTVKYELDSFVHEYNTQVSVYTGYPLFQEMQSGNIADLEKWNAARKTAYNGSILHFMRSMYQKRLAEEGFEIQFIVKDNNNKEASIKVKDFYGAMNYIKDDSSHIVEILPNQKEVAVIYKNETADPLYVEANPDASPKFQLSVVSFIPNESLGIEQNGFYFDQNDITITGYWAWEKVGDMVPYDFNFKQSSPPVAEQINAVTTEPVKPVGIEVKTATEQPKNTGGLLTNVTWKMEESRGNDGVNRTYYVRGGQGNTVNFDNDFYKFNTDNTGVYTSNGQENKFSWQYLDTERTQIEMVILYPRPLVVSLSNIILTESTFKYTRSQNVNGIHLIAS